MDRSRTSGTSSGESRRQSPARAAAKSRSRTPDTRRSDTLRRRVLTSSANKLERSHTTTRITPKSLLIDSIENMETAEPVQRKKRQIPAQVQSAAKRMRNISSTSEETPRTMVTRLLNEANTVTPAVNVRRRRSQPPGVGHLDEVVNRVYQRKSDSFINNSDNADVDDDDVIPSSRPLASVKGRRKMDKFVESIKHSFRSGRDEESHGTSSQPGQFKRDGLVKFASALRQIAGSDLVSREKDDDEISGVDLVSSSDVEEVKAMDWEFMTRNQDGSSPLVPVLTPGKLVKSARGAQHPSRDVTGITSPRALHLSGDVTGITSPRALHLSGDVTGITSPRAQHPSRDVTGITAPRAIAPIVISPSKTGTSADIFGNASTHSVPRAGASPQSVPRAGASPHSVRRPRASTHSVPRAGATPQSVPRARPSPHSVPRAGASPHSVRRPRASPQSVPRAEASPHSVPRAGASPQSAPRAGASPQSVPRAGATPQCVPRAGASPHSVRRPRSLTQSGPRAGASPQSVPRARPSPQSVPRAGASPQNEPRPRSLPQTVSRSRESLVHTVPRARQSHSTTPRDAMSPARAGSPPMYAGKISTSSFSPPLETNDLGQRNDNSSVNDAPRGANAVNSLNKVPTTTQLYAGKRTATLFDFFDSLQTNQLREPVNEAKMKNKTKKKLPVVKSRQMKEKVRKRELGMSAAAMRDMFKHFCRFPVTKDAFTEIEKMCEMYWEGVASDLSAYAAHAKRQYVNSNDMELLMRRQRFITDRESLHSLVEKNLPLEYREKIIPVARSGNKIEGVVLKAARQYIEKK